MDLFSLFGLIANLIGAISLAFSINVIDPLKGCKAKIEIKGHKVTTTSIRKNPFYIGIALLIIGFLLQLIALFTGQFI